MASSEKDLFDNDATRESEEEAFTAGSYDVSEALLGSVDKLPSKTRLLRFFDGSNLTTYLLMVSLFIIIFEGVLLIRATSSLQTIQSRLTTSNGLSYERTIDRKVYEHSKYLSHDEAEASQAWDSILAGHGVIALDADYVAAKNLPASVVLPDGSGKFMYIIEAYHAIHCIKTIRAHYVALEKSQTWNWSRPHDMHCFDALRQYVMCNVDDTILWTTGHRESGTGQSKMCNDWSALRDFAEEKSAHYFDVEPGMGMPHLGNYHEGDGLSW